MRTGLFRTLLVMSMLWVAPAALCDDGDEAAVSPKAPWGEFTVVEEKEGFPWWADVLLWLPNRFMDLIDIFRVDVGAGASVGAVARVSKYGQFGYRHMTPLSVRIGAFGRSRPFIVERSDEYGVGPRFHQSRDRKVCPGEIGAGADAFLVGVYGGVCFEELLDFVAGIFFLDVSGDDLK